jgi:hypothetical protein
MLDPNWTPEAGYAHALHLMGQRSGKSPALARAESWRVDDGARIVYDVCNEHNDGKEQHEFNRTEDKARSQLSATRVRGIRITPRGDALPQLQGVQGITSEADDAGTVEGERMNDDRDLAPYDEAWHHMYVHAHLEAGRLFSDLMNHPAFEDGEDLKDWVETVATLLSFRPQTLDEIELVARESYRKEHDA